MSVLPSRFLTRWFALPLLGLSALVACPGSDPGPSKGVLLTPDFSSIPVGAIETLQAVVLDETGKEVLDSIDYSSSDPNVLSVNARGDITGVGPGTAIVQAKSGKSTSNPVSVRVLPTSESMPAELSAKYLAHMVLGEQILSSVLANPMAFTYPKPPLSNVVADGSTSRNTFAVDADADGIPTSSSSALGGSYAQATVNLDYSGQVLLRDENDASKSSGYRIQAMGLQADGTALDSRYRLTNNSVIDANPTGNTYKLTVRSRTEADVFSSVGRFETAFTADYVPDNLNNPALGGTLSYQGSSFVVANNQGYRFSERGEGLHASSSCHRYDAGKISFSDGTGQRIELKFVGCNSFAITRNDQAFQTSTVGIGFSTPSMQLGLGASTTLKPILTDPLGNTQTNLVWSSSDPSRVSVNNSGQLNGLSNTGNRPAIITAKAGINSASIGVAVGAPRLSSISLNPTSGTIKVGQALALTASAKDLDGNTLQLSNDQFSWGTSAPGIATVARGVVTGKGPGTVNISASAFGLTSTPVAISVQQVISGGVVIDPASLVLKPNQPASVNAFVRRGGGLGDAVVSAEDPANGISCPAVLFSANDGSKALTCTGSKVIVSPVQVTIQLRTPDGQLLSDSTKLSVIVTNRALSVTPTSLSLLQDQPEILTPTLLDDNGNPDPSATFSFSTLEPAIATTSTTDGITGNVTGTSVGQTTITVSSGTGAGALSVEVPVTVTNFTHTATPTALTVTRPDTSTQVITSTLTAVAGFAGPITYSLEGAPTGVLFPAVVPNPVALSSLNTSNITLTVPTTVPAGSYNFDLVASSGTGTSAVKRKVPMTLTIGP